MKKPFLFISLFFLCFYANAKDVGGPIVENTIWAKVESPIIIKSNVTVIEDVTLIIEPGVTVKFDEDRALIVNGTLIAKGSEAERIVFTSNGEQRPGYWGFIFFSNTSRDALFDRNGNYTEGCIIQYADIRWGGSTKPVVSVNNSSPFIADSVIVSNRGRGISIYEGSPVIRSCEIKDNDGGIYYYGDESSNPIIQNSNISGNHADKGGGIYLASGALTIQNSTISGNSALKDDIWNEDGGGGIYAISGVITISNSTIAENSSDVYGGSGGGIYVRSCTLRISDSTISGNSSGDDQEGYGGGICARESSTLMLSGSTISDNSAREGGGIYVSSSTVNMSGNRIIGNTSPPFKGVVRLENLNTGSMVGGTSPQDANVIKDNIGDGVYIKGNLTLNYNDIYGNAGFSLVCGNPAGADPIDARNCYWGGKKKSVAEGVIWDGLDDPDLGLVTYEPFLTVPCKVDDTTPPSAITDLTVSSSTANSITLTWTAPGDDGSVGVAAEYDIRYSTSEITDANWDIAAQCANEPKPKEAGNFETFTVTDLKPDTTYYFAVKTADEIQNWSGLSNVVSGTTLSSSDKTPPAAVTNLTVFALKDAVTLLWTAPGDDGNVGTATAYKIRYSSRLPFNWDTATEIENPPLPHPAGTREEITIAGVSSTCYFALKAVDDAGNWSEISNIATGKEIKEIGKFAVNLVKGLNIVSLPLKPDSDMRAEEFAELLEATVVVRLNKETQRFEPFIPEFGGTNFAIEGGEGYIVNVLEGKTVEFKGKAWFSSPNLKGEDEESVWTFVVGGDVERGDFVLVRNIRTGEAINSTVRENRFAVVLGGIQGRDAVKKGDVLEILAYNKGKLTGRCEMQVGIDQLERALALAYIRRSPEKTVLLPNYPNPFNPETWIPFRLAEDGEVVIRIYDLRGRLVRKLALGRLKAGIYERRDRAAYWDGRNEMGESVSSGIYVIELSTSGYRAVRKACLMR
jgi:hypothetical protein